MLRDVLLLCVSDRVLFNGLDDYGERAAFCVAPVTVHRKIVRASKLLSIYLAFVLFLGFAVSALAQFTTARLNASRLLFETRHRIRFGVQPRLRNV